jgi:hypothetical protein
MTPEMREKLLLRMFSSIEYMENYAQHFIEFIDTGLLALDVYEKSPSKPTADPDYSNVVSDVRLWKLKVKPNFIGMKENMEEALVNARAGKFSTIRSAAGNFRGLSKDMDGIRESFMDFIDPAIKEKYFEEWKTVSLMGDNIYYTLSDYWDPQDFLNEEITGVIDEKELLRYLSADEEP